jgi:hypothetical protein
VRRHYAKVEQEQRRAGLTETLARLRALQRHAADRSEHDALPPDRGAITQASAWIRELRRDASATAYAWRPPHVTASAEGEVVFEWWNEPKKLTVYVAAGEVTYVRAWGTDITAEMDEGDASTSTSRGQIWTWLMS